MNKEEQILELLLKMDSRLENVEDRVGQIPNDIKQSIDNAQKELRTDFNRRFDNLDMKFDDDLSSIRKDLIELKTKVG